MSTISLRLPAIRRRAGVNALIAGQLTRAAVELAKNWRTDKYLRRLDVRFQSDLHSPMHRMVLHDTVADWQ